MSNQPIATLPQLESSPAIGEAPKALTEAELTIAGTAGTATGSTTASSQVPTMAPPGTPGALAAQDGAGLWHSGRKVVALWANRSARNAHAYLDGVGWRRLADTSDSAHASLAMLASAARQTGSAVNARDEGDGRIREIYLW